MCIRDSNYDVNGTTYRANASDPYVEGPAAVLTGVVYGMDNLQYQHPLATRADLNQPSAPKLSATAARESLGFTSDCFTGRKTESYTTGGSIPTATYTGNAYTDNSAGCEMCIRDSQDYVRSHRVSLEPILS